MHQIKHGPARMASMNTFVGIWTFIYEPAVFLARFLEEKQEALDAATSLRRMWEMKERDDDEKKESAAVP
jgi:hypothetical protein